MVYRFIASIWAVKHIVLERCIVHGNINTTAVIQVNKYARKRLSSTIDGNKLILFAFRFRNGCHVTKNSSVSHSLFITCIEMVSRTIEIDDDIKISITLLLFTQQFTMMYKWACARIIPLDYKEDGGKKKLPRPFHCGTVCADIIFLLVWIEFCIQYIVHLDRYVECWIEKVGFSFHSTCYRPTAGS